MYWESYYQSLDARLCGQKSGKTPGTSTPETNAPAVDGDDEAVVDPLDITGIKAGKVTINGKEVAVLVKNIKDADLTEEQTAVIEKLLANFTTETQKTLLESVCKGLKVKAINYCKLIDLTLEDGVEIPEGGIKISIYDDSIDADKTYVMLHLKADGTWENIPVSVKDGVITGKFTSLSPVLYAEVEQAADSTYVAPKTGDTNTSMYVLALAAVVACGAAVFAVRKVKYVR